MEQCTDKSLLSMMSKDILATNIYTLGYKDKAFANLDFTTKVKEYKE